MSTHVVSPVLAKRISTKRKEVSSMEVFALAVVVLLWIAFAALLFFSQSSIDDTWTWFKNRSPAVQIPLGFMFLPWIVGAWIWESSWPVAARGILVAGLAWANVYAFSPWKPFS